MNEKEIIQKSKFLSLVLRHKPEQIGLVLDANGWAPVSELIDKSKQHGVLLTTEEIKSIVETNNKKRFALSEHNEKIRANQGHSVEVDLQLMAVIPPPVLYHGSAEKYSEAIQQNGILKMSRQHVHLSADRETAFKVGSRHGKPVIFQMNTAAMTEAGILFYQSENGVWLTDYVPAKYLSL